MSGTDLLTLRQTTIAAAVSILAKSDTEEFVAEVFAGLMCGVEYDKDILRLYTNSEENDHDQILSMQLLHSL